MNSETTNACAAMLAWHAASEDAWRAYRAWDQALNGFRREAYTAYLAAVDQEDAAAAELARASDVCDPAIVWPERQALAGSNWVAP